MKIKDLIKILKQFDDEKDVLICGMDNVHIMEIINHNGISANHILIDELPIDEIFSSELNHTKEQTNVIEYFIDENSDYYQDIKTVTLQEIAKEVA